MRWQPWWRRRRATDPRAPTALEAVIFGCIAGLILYLALYTWEVWHRPPVRLAPIDTTVEVTHG